MAKVGKPRKILGTHAILGMDIVSFSQLDNVAQAAVIAQLLGWIRAAIQGEEVAENDYRWSPAGDGGFLTFESPDGCAKAILVAIAIARILREPQRNKTGVRMKFAVHCGQVIEAEELGRVSNIWGEGINTAARILYVCAPSQILVSEQYFDSYIAGKYSQARLHCSASPFFRTVKHGVQIQVRNVHDSYAGLSESVAGALRWSAVGGILKRTISEYEFLIADAMNSKSPIAALAAAKFLLGLDAQAQAAQDLVHIVSHFGNRPSVPYQRCVHEVFSQLPPATLQQLLQLATTRTFGAGQLICRAGDLADSCFFTVSGMVEVEVGASHKTLLGQGEMLGEFGLWIADVPRTATVIAHDECVLLEIPFRAFHQTVARHPSVLEAVAAMVKQRILHNVAHCLPLFPALAPDERQRLMESPITCEKRSPGETIDLRHHSFILFSGQVRTYIGELNSTPSPLHFDITARGLSDAQTAVGILTPDEPASIDGDVAHILAESVLVTIPRPLLLDLQLKHDRIAHAWSALWGARRGEIKRRLRSVRG